MKRAPRCAILVVMILSNWKKRIQRFSLVVKRQLRSRFSVGDDDWWCEPVSLVLPDDELVEEKIDDEGVIDGNLMERMAGAMFLRAG